MTSMFDKLEKALNITISEPLKNVLRGQKLDQECVLANFDISRLPILEEYARSRIYLKRVGDTEDKELMKKFFGEGYCDEPENFKFTEGDEVQLRGMIWALSKYKRRPRKIQINKELDNQEDFDSDLEKIDTTPADDANTIKTKLMQSRPMRKLEAAQKSKLQAVEVTEVTSSGAYIACSYCRTKIKVIMIGGRCQLTNFTKHFLKHTRAVAEEDEEIEQNEQTPQETPRNEGGVEQEIIDVSAVDAQPQSSDGSLPKSPHMMNRQPSGDEAIAEIHDRPDSFPNESFAQSSGMQARAHGSLPNAPNIMNRQPSGDETIAEILDRSDSFLNESFAQSSGMQARTSSTQSSSSSTESSQEYQQAKRARLEDAFINGHSSDASTLTAARGEEYPPYRQEHYTNDQSISSIINNLVMKSPPAQDNKFVNNNNCSNIYRPYQIEDM